MYKWKSYISGATCCLNVIPLFGNSKRIANCFKCLDLISYYSIYRWKIQHLRWLWLCMYYLENLPSNSILIRHGPWFLGRSQLVSKYIFMFIVALKSNWNMQSLTVCTIHSLYIMQCSFELWQLTLAVSVKTKLCISARVESQCGLMETLFLKGLFLRCQLSIAKAADCN